VAKKSATSTSVKAVEKNIREDQDGANVVGAMPHRRAREEKNVIDVNTTNNIHKFIEVAVKKLQLTRCSLESLPRPQPNGQGAGE
jgi:hypothetical protein